MTGNEIRQCFLQYFESKGHTRVAASSLVPHDDPTLLFVNSGMVQFKKVFMGEETRPYVRATSAQCSVRAGGKHNDLENVGYTARHHTFFEMLGNFSFGDYFKKEAIDFAWEFLTVKLGFDPKKLWISVYEDDDEAFALWEQVEDLPKGRIVRMGEKDNFWAMGDTGPCGPCSEIHIDQGAEVGCGRPDCVLGCDCDRFLELWNLVFMQFNRDETGTMTPLPKPSIDTGMGLERVAAVLQGKVNNYDCDLFSPIIEHIAGQAGRPYHANDKDDVSMRVIADHARATTFLVADGVLPSNEGRGYVLRRIMRRAIRYGRSLGLSSFFPGICALVTEHMHEAYPHLNNTRELLAKVVTNEEQRFGETLDHGLQKLDQEIDRLQNSNSGPPTIQGDFIFKLYDTYGFPVDIVRDVAIERDVSFDEAGFTLAMEQQREQSRKSWKGGDVDHLDVGVIELAGLGKKSEFIGYSSTQGLAVVEAIINREGQLAAEAKMGDTVRLFCNQTPFYAESGGQIGDQGEITWAGGRFLVEKTLAPVEGLILHQGEIVQGILKTGTRVDMQVAARRADTVRNHTATHLLQAALKKILGDHIKQAGSAVDHNRLRFDFTHFSPLSLDEIFAVEQLVNQQIRDNTPVASTILGRDEAMADGATALFGEKYGDEVRVVSIGGFSKELCGGTHAQRTGDLGLFKIIIETGIAAGVRRIEAVTGAGAVHWMQEMDRQATAVSTMISGPFEGAAEKIQNLLRRQKDLEKQVASLNAAMALSDLDRYLAASVEVDGLRVIAAKVPLDSPKTLREIGDKIRDRMGSGIIVLGGELDNKAALLAMVSKEYTGRIKAGDLINRVARIVGGKGGGRPDMAQAGGPMADKLDEAVSSVAAIVRELAGGGGAAAA
ncbi:alanine--tRNA ligase [Desulfobulbus alkaliphilus]|uniref:alanine--tRNA ligase n=1 Tax=Desulfobulbus alkaliphilus TaxID=869814 RepID=UPI001962F6E4|nr:alanine--tRNA ligase [Desulfobulbus alkaliphilus]MBM9537267.1 alanine--tRNA ligase [Desulfobulbus alkaliphilus]